VIKLKKNVIWGKSLQEFILKSRKGINIPNSMYNNKSQEKIYNKFILDHQIFFAITSWK
jgi:hypothetical protein